MGSCPVVERACMEEVFSLQTHPNPHLSFGALSPATAALFSSTLFYVLPVSLSPSSICVCLWVLPFLLLFWLPVPCSYSLCFLQNICPSGSHSVPFFPKSFSVCVNSSNAFFSFSVSSLRTVTHPQPLPFSAPGPVMATKFALLDPTRHRLSPCRIPHTFS